jgi:hypothetical protein
MTTTNTTATDRVALTRAWSRAHERAEKATLALNIAKLTSKDAASLVAKEEAAWAVERAAAKAAGIPPETE